MARSDWTAHAGTLALDGAHVRSGGSAVMTPASNESRMVATWDQSAADSPAYGKFRSYFYFTDVGWFKVFFRRQDADNMYMVGVRSNYGDDVVLHKVAGGTETTYIDGVSPNTNLTTGSWSDNLARPLKDTSPDMPGGGGIGFGHDRYTGNGMGYDFWVDDSEVFY